MPELSKGDTGRAFAVFYTGVIGDGGIAVIVYGAIADRSSRAVGISTAAATAALIASFVVRLRWIYAPPPILAHGISRL